MKYRSLLTSIIFSAILCVLVLPALADDTVLPIPTQPKEPAVISLDKNVDVICPIVDALCTGHVTNINNGTIEMFSLVPIDDNNLVMNFGYGTIVSRENIGELFSFAGRNYIRATAPNKPPQLLSTYQNVRTPLSVGLYNRSTVSPRIFRINYSNPVLLQALMNKAVQDIQAPVMVLGWVDMPEMNGEALKRAPVDGVSLNGDKRGDYIESVTGKNIHVIFAALAIPCKARQTISSALFLDKVFNITPPSKDSENQISTVIFAKAAITEDAIPENYNTSPIVLSKMNVANIKDICTLLPTSTISKGILIFYQPKLKVMTP